MQSEPQSDHAEQSNQQVDPTATHNKTPTNEPGRDTASELIQTLGRVEIDDLRSHHVTLVIAVAELSRDAGLDWPWGPDDPTVALLRAAAKLAIDAPEAASEHAAFLRRALTDAGQ